MKKLRKLVAALSEEDVVAIRRSFYRPTDKMAQLFELIIGAVSNEEIRSDLVLSPNAFSTLGSRLIAKIQNHLIESTDDSPREDVINKLISIDKIIFTEDRTIAISTLKKLERELIRYDLSNELTVIYKHLKKLYINKPEYHKYSKLYNTHIAYSLALDKAEDLLGRYFIEFGYFFVMNDISRMIALKATYEELKNVNALYKSHRMTIYLSILEVMHRLYVDSDNRGIYKKLPIEDVFSQVDSIVKRYPGDTVYENLKLLIKFIRFEYYFKYEIYDKAIQLLELIIEEIPLAIIHYENYGFPSKALHNLMLIKQNENIRSEKLSCYNFPVNFDFEGMSVPARIIIQVYQAIDFFIKREFDQSSKTLYTLTNLISLKAYPGLLAEIKCITALIKLYQDDRTLFKQNLTSVQRILRKNPGSCPEHVVIFVKLLSILNSSSDRNRESKIKIQLAKLKAMNRSGYKPLLYLNQGTEELMNRIN